MASGLGLQRLSAPRILQLGCRLCVNFSGLIWTWETFISELSRAGAPELDAPGDTTQQDSINPPSVTTRKVYSGKTWTSEPRGGERRKDAAALQNYLHPPASRIISLGFGRARGADDRSSAGRARGAHAANMPKRRPHETGGGWKRVPWGPAMDGRWVCQRQKIQKSGRPRDDGKPHSVTAAQVYKSQSAWRLQSEQGGCGGWRCVKSKLPSEDRRTSRRKGKARKVEVQQKTCRLVRNVGAFCSDFFCKAEKGSIPNVLPWFLLDQGMWCCWCVASECGCINQAYIVNRIKKEAGGFTFEKRSSFSVFQSFEEVHRVPWKPQLTAAGL